MQPQFQYLRCQTSPRVSAAWDWVLDFAYPHSPLTLQERRCHSYLMNEDTQGTGVQRRASSHRRRCSSHLGLVWFHPVLPSTPPPARTALAGLPVAEDRAPPTWEPVKGSSVSASLCESCAVLEVARGATAGGPVVLLNPKGVHASQTNVQALADCSGS